MSPRFHPEAGRGPGRADVVPTAQRRKLWQSVGQSLPGLLLGLKWLGWGLDPPKGHFLLPRPLRLRGGGFPSESLTCPGRPTPALPPFPPSELSFLPGRTWVLISGPSWALLVLGSGCRERPIREHPVRTSRNGAQRPISSRPHTCSAQKPSCPRWGRAAVAAWCCQMRRVCRAWVLPSALRGSRGQVALFGLFAFVLRVGGCRLDPFSSPMGPGGTSSQSAGSSEEAPSCLPAASCTEQSTESVSHTFPLRPRTVKYSPTNPVVALALRVLSCHRLAPRPTVSSWGDPCLVSVRPCHCHGAPRNSTGHSALCAPGSEAHSRATGWLPS
ncbi:uncharacterized protein LOC106007682 [Heterocephalus glaber]|uniref:Uncharacterized protein LOC106007682 n=1 Tax=Heterocephalus glaber TaxID=10181 RepID=A0AAX6QKB8_HETGA|nr:uncharacterized protein LOC106007682 [Heterocephalus glaber]XP_012920666.1 uncharacterized protein LOC106007682 [Heterocephalus glaber]XP_012920667.1 uncharacterized protein LOC106007682 [Heterocephalus glaber]